MAKVKIFNNTKQLINLNVRSMDGTKEIMVPLVARGCAAIDSSQETPDIAIKRKKGMIRVERAPEPAPVVKEDKPEPAKDDEGSVKDKKKEKRDKIEK